MGNIGLLKKNVRENSLAVQWLRLFAFTAEHPGSIPGRGTKIPHATQHSQKKKEREREYENKPQICS